MSLNLLILSSNLRRQSEDWLYWMHLHNLIEARKEGKDGCDDLWLLWSGIWKTLERGVVHKEVLMELMKKEKEEEWNQTVQRPYFCRDNCPEFAAEAVWSSRWLTSCLVARGGRGCAAEAAGVHVLVEDVPDDPVGNLFSDSVLQHSCCVGPAPGCNCCHICEVQMHRIHPWLRQGGL